MGDVPDVWILALLRREAENGIDTGKIENMNARSNTPFRHAFYYLSGLSKQFPITEDLLEHVVLADVVSKLMKTRGDLINKHGGLFTSGMDENGLIKFTEGHGLFAFYPRPEEGHTHWVLLDVTFSTHL